MKRMIIWSLTALAVLAVIRGPVAASPENGEGEGDHSPYFFVRGESGVDSFPLLKTEAAVDISGVIAEINLTQVYKNDGDTTIEAVYVFPLGTKAAIHSMKMTIGERTIEAEIEEKFRARTIYEDAKESGRTASLLEQKRPNVFTMNVANIMPGDTVRVEVGYTELLVPEEGIYRYVFPTVVGPRFTGEDPEGESWTATPYLHQGDKPPCGFDIRVTLNAGMPITDFSVKTHRVEVMRPSADRAVVTLADSETTGGNRDFIFSYSLEGDSIQSGLLLYPGEEENFFLMMMEPPEKVSPAMIPPREYVFIVDVSGSMNGFPLDVSKELIDKLLKGLRPNDYFNILFFAGGSKTLSPVPLPATEANRVKALRMLHNQRGGGGTRILNALETALALEKKEGVSRVIVAVTDGYVSVEKEAFDLIRQKAGEANFFAFGIGSSVNRYLIEGMARAGQGEPFVAIDNAGAEETAERFLRYIQTPLLTDIEVTFDGFEAYDVEPPALPDLFADRPLILFGKYRTAAGTIKVTGRTPEGIYRREFAVSPRMEKRDNAALRYLWARESIARLADYGRVGDDVKEEVTGLGLKYSLMTEYTSFVAVDTEVRETGETVTVKQPLPLPQGVSDLAVGGNGLVNCRIRSMGPAPGRGVALSQAEACSEILLRKDAVRRVSVAGGTTPAGITLDRAEKILLDAAGEKLSKIFREWKLERLSLTLTVASGKVTAVVVDGYTGETCRIEVLEKIFSGIGFPGAVTGTLKIDLIFA